MFPEQVWTGKTPSRKNLSDTMAASHQDFVAIVREIQAVEQYVLNIANNNTLIPDLDSKIKEADEKLAALRDRIDNLTVPADLMARIEIVEDRLTEFDVRNEVIKLRSDLSLAERSLTEIKITTEALHSSIKSDLAALQHVTRNEMSKFRTMVDAKFAEQAKENERLNRLLAISSQIQELKKS